MANSTVFENEVIIGFESVFGTAPVDGLKVSVVSYSPTVTKNQTVTPEINGLVVDGKPTSGFRNTEIDLTIRVRQKTIGWFLRAFIAVPVTTGVGPYTHTFTPSLTAIESLTIEHGLTTLGDYYSATGCKISSMSITVGGDGDLQVTFKLMGIDYQYAATSGFTGVVTDITTETTLFNNFDGSITNPANPTIDQYTININRNLEMFQELDGTPTASLAIEGKYSADGTIQMLFEDDTILAAARNNTSDSFVGILENGANSLKFNFPTIVWDENALAADAGTVKQVITPKYTQFGDFTVVLINDQASYA